MDIRETTVSQGSEHSDKLPAMNPLSTERLLFRAWRAEDLKHAMHLWGDPEVMLYLDIRGGLSREQVSVKLGSEISCLQRHGLQYWPIFLRCDGAFIGCCGLRPWLHSPRGGFELGFHLVREAWGHAYAFEAASAVVQHAKTKKFSHLMAGHHPKNVGSRKVLEKLGFAYVEDVLYAPTGLMHPTHRLELR